MAMVIVQGWRHEAVSIVPCLLLYLRKNGTFLITETFFFKMCTFDNETSVKVACVTSLRSKNMAATVANKLEKGTNLSACPPQLAITHLWAHLHPKSKLIHFAKSSAVLCFACWWAAGWRFFLQSSVQPQKLKGGDVWGAGGLLKKNKTKTMLLCKNTLSALRHTSGCTVWKKIKC